MGCKSPAVSYQEIFSDDFESGNTLAWSSTVPDRWISVDDGDGQQWKQVLTDYGYDTANPVACAGQCPPGNGPKVMMIFHFRIPMIAEQDSTWVHAMKQEADGDWSSKNGEGSRWKDIADYMAFLDKHYPVAPPLIRSVQCFCK